MFIETEWIRGNSEKLCNFLTKTLTKTYRTGKWIPCFLHKPLRYLKHTLKRIPVVVQIDPDHLATAQTVDTMGRTLGCKVKHDLGYINSFSTELNVKAIQKLAVHNAVAKIWLDRQVKALLDTATPTVNALKVWDVGLRGEGMCIAIIDTGIYPHPDLTTPKNRIIGFKDFVKGRTKPYDDNGHGTHCAGDAAGNGVKSGGKYRGPAPAANLVGIKALDKTGAGRISNLLAGIQWCITNKSKYGINVLSMSLGAAAGSSYTKDPLCQAVEKVWKAGIVVCVAAGNEGPAKGSISSPGIDPRVITVGAYDDRGTRGVTDDTIAQFSSRGPTIDGLTKPDVISPGVNIVSLRTPRSFLDRSDSQARVGQWYFSLSGTSMATPITAGVVALILQGCPGLTPEKVKNLLMSTCRTVNMASNTQGAGAVDAIRAVRRCRVKP